MASNYPNGGPGFPPAGGPGYPPPGSPPPGGPIVPAGMVERIRNILLTPSTEWARIAAEPDTAQNVFLKWAVPLAAIGPICSIIGQQVFGINAIIIHYRPTLTFSIVNGVAAYVMSLIGTWAAALVVEALAPSFGGIKNRDQAMKVVAYSWTAAWLAGIFQLVPILAILGLVGLYSLYLLWLGLPTVMRSPPDKSVGYVAVTILALIVIYVVIFFVVGVVTRIVAPSAIPTITAARDGGAAPAPHVALMTSNSKAQG